MAETITLNIEHGNKQYEIKAQVEPRGYTYRVLVYIQDQAVYFEPDEEGNFRALAEEPNRQGLADRGLLQNIASLLNEALG